MISPTRELISTRSEDNLNKKERNALKELKLNKDIIIRTTDKGIVVLDAGFYCKLNVPMLSDTTTLSFS